MLQKSKFTALSMLLILATSAQAFADATNYSRTIIKPLLRGKVFTNKNIQLAKWNQAVIVSEAEFNGSLFALEAKALTNRQKVGDPQCIPLLIPRKGIFA
jgi:hypothetical protein